VILERVDESGGALESLLRSGEQVDTGFSCDAPAISADGRYVAFHSDGAGLVPNDTSTNSDVFVRDRVLGKTERVSVGSDGETPIGNGTEFGNSLDPAISANGRFVAFTSSARNLIPGRQIFETHVYVRDLVAGTTEIVSERPDGQTTAQPLSRRSPGTGVTSRSSPTRKVSCRTTTTSVPMSSCATATLGRRRPCQCPQQAL
jgi:Tol biopolymer transport system component